jgi:hypothetical protein
MTIVLLLAIAIIVLMVIARRLRPAITDEQLEMQRRERKHRWQGLLIAVGIPVGLLAAIVLAAIVAGPH